MERARRLLPWRSPNGEQNLGHIMFEVNLNEVRHSTRVYSFPPIGGFPPIFHGFLTPLRSVQIWG